MIQQICCIGKGPLRVRASSSLAAPTSRDNLLRVVRTEVVQQVGERVAELDHALRGQCHLRARPAARQRLRHAQEPPARVLLQIQVVATIVLQIHIGRYAMLLPLVSLLLLN